MSDSLCTDVNTFIAYVHAININIKARIMLPLISLYPEGLILSDVFACLLLNVQCDSAVVYSYWYTDY